MLVVVVVVVVIVVVIIVVVVVVIVVVVIVVVAGVVLIAVVIVVVVVVVVVVEVVIVVMLIIIVVVIVIGWRSSRYLQFRVFMFNRLTRGNPYLLLQPQDLRKSKKTKNANVIGTDRIPKPGISTKTQNNPTATTPWM